MNRREALIERLKILLCVKSDTELANLFDTTRQNIFNYKSKDRHDLQTKIIEHLVAELEKKN